MPPVAVQDDLPVFNGADGDSCFQDVPQWLIDGVEEAGLEWETFHRTETDGDDCLFLDVARLTELPEDTSLPVLVGSTEADIAPKTCRHTHQPGFTGGQPVTSLCTLP